MARTNCPTSPIASACKPWDLTTQYKTNNLADSYLQESLNIAGAQINVYKMLGVHEQTKLVDLAGTGSSISSGDIPTFPSSNAFDKTTAEWRSRHTSAELVRVGYIGYDFGVARLPSNRQTYGVRVDVTHEITTIRIKQGAKQGSRVTKARVERSIDGVNWYGVAIVVLPDDDLLNTVHFKNSAPARYWRLRPLEHFGQECDYWVIQAFELIAYDVTSISNIQDKILLENRDRDYMQTPITLKGYYSLVQANTDLQKFGIELDASYSIQINFNGCVAELTRPIVIGDIIELPSEVQYTPDLRPVQRFLEVTDVAWDSTSYTPGWMPLMLSVTALPVLASQETQDIFGDLAFSVDDSGLFNNNSGNNKMFQDFTNVDQAIRDKGLKDAPEKGSEGSNTIREFEPDVLEKASQYGIKHLSRYGLNRTGLYVEDAIPQNQAPYTEGPVMPTSPQDGDYHRLTYEGLAKDVPARLHRYSVAKSRWVYLETDRRSEFDNQKNILTEYITSPTKQSARDIK